MKKSEPLFRVFLFSGILILVGLAFLILPVFNLVRKKAGGTSVNFANKPTKDEEKEFMDHLFVD